MLLTIRKFFEEFNHPHDCHNKEIIGQKMVDKHLYESIGFSNGLNPITDTRAVGVLGPLVIINFLERIELIYKNTDEELD